MAVSKSKGSDAPERRRNYIIVFPPEIEREIQKILDDAARRLYEEHLAHIGQKIKRDAACDVCRQRTEAKAT